MSRIRAANASPATGSSTPRDLLPWLLGLAVLVAAAAGFSWWRLQEAERSAAVAAEQRAEAEELSRRLVEASADAEAGGPGGEEAEVPLNQIVGAAAAARGISAGDSGLRVEPGQPARVGRTDWERVPLRVSLREVTLEQATGLLADVRNGVPDLVVDELRLSAPRRTAAGAAGGGAATGPETWNLEAELSRLQHRPEEPGS